MSFDGLTMMLLFKSNKTRELFNAQFNPIYYSISDEWVEDYSSLASEKTDKKLEHIIDEVGQSWPERKSDFQNAALYFANAMEWSIRFVSYETPELSLRETRV